ncbi:MAG: hypothetical protein SLAVMIC_00743 [uncultured marine phage]|uniref:Uncharacterized protein n=1 Tax=uncultured marine phage TaxID=707152 RepID=A0A8D9C9F7_9VIRU|nr:MAG: hypothetical protein SLAVMIC_00743 [uncultured marine phage]
MLIIIIIILLSIVPFIILRASVKKISEYRVLREEYHSEKEKVFDYRSNLYHTDRILYGEFNVRFTEHGVLSYGYFRNKHATDKNIQEVKEKIVDLHGRFPEIFKQEYREDRFKKLLENEK